MKKLLLGLAICAVTGLAYGQGLATINTSKTDSYIRFSNTVTRAWCSGDADVVWGLYYGATAGNYDKLLFSSTNGFYTGTGGFKGCITSSGGVKALEVPAGTPAYFQLKAWSAGYTSWEAAKASGLSTVLISLQIPEAIYTPGPATGNPPPTPATIPFAPGTSSAGSQMIVELVPVPEPSIIALAGLGLAGLIFIRRRK